MPGPVMIREHIPQHLHDRATQPQPARAIQGDLMAPGTGVQSLLACARRRGLNAPGSRLMRASHRIQATASPEHAARKADLANPFPKSLGLDASLPFKHATCRMLEPLRGYFWGGQGFVTFRKQGQREGKNKHNM